MQFLRTAFWVALAIVIVVFSVNNWTPVTVNLWDGLRMDTKLPVLVIGAFLLGSFPLWLFHRAVCWRWRRRLDTVERAMSETRPAAPVETHKPVLSSSAPSAIPPGAI